jgi:cytochrome c oxidase assembly factor CtaG
LEHVCYLAAGVLLWWPVFQDVPHRLSSAARALYLFLAFVLASPIGLLLALLPEAAYDSYVDGDRLWGLSAHADQQIAGVTMSVEQAIVFFAVFAVFFFRFLAEEEAREGPGAEKIGRSAY